MSRRDVALSHQRHNEPDDRACEVGDEVDRVVREGLLRRLEVRVVDVLLDAMPTPKVIHTTKVVRKMTLARSTTASAHPT
jgi:hypothetical protein